jgi:carboxyl-terminal processing protease
MVPFSKFRNLILGFTCLLLAGGIGYRFGQQHVSVSVANDKIVFNKTVPQNTPLDFSLFWDVWNRVHRDYIDAAQIDNQKLFYGAVSGMVNAIGDPYTTFLPPTDNSQFKQDMSGSFEGIGAELGTKENHIMVISPLTGSPAEKAGIKPADWILKVNGDDTSNWTVNDAVTKIRGPKGTKVTLSILHVNDIKAQDITITRDTIVTPQIISWVKKPSDIKEVMGLTDFKNKYSGNSKEVAYLRLTRFGDQLESEWSKAVDQIVQDESNQNLAGMILDLRSNPGGYLDGAVYVGSEFIKNGIVVSQKNSDGSKLDYPVNRTGKLLDIPLIVLVNNGSASAAEIVTGALKDTHRATVVGETTFGKGSVQTPQDLAGGASVHITTGKWLTPKGESISKKGITPDTIITSDTVVDASHDAQLAKAIELLLK